VARRLAKDFGRVYYSPDHRQNNPDFNECCIGDGYGDIVHCSDLWMVKDKVDAFVFPDIGYMGEQLELRSQGFSVWGAGRAMRLETNREFFLKKLEELGLDVAPHEIVVGTDALRAFLKDREDIFIKLSKFRKSWETYHWRSWKQDAHMLDYWAVKFGGARNLIRFLCFEKIETTLEIGGDTYNVHGEWPDTMLHGLEHKDEAYFSAVTKRKEMPEELTEIMDKFSPFMRECGAATQWSMEVRVADEGNFFIDATVRGGLPSTASLLKAKNVSQIIYHGAHGEMVEPEYGFKFSAECMVKIKSEDGIWGTIVLEPELKDALLLADCCEVEGQDWFPSDDKDIEHVGWLRATGDTPTEVAKEMNRLADLLPDGADASVEDLAAIIREIEEEEKQGIHFTDLPMPDQGVVLEQ
jgi:hypothetical protein